MLIGSPWSNGVYESGRKYKFPGTEYAGILENFPLEPDDPYYKKTTAKLIEKKSPIPLAK